LKIYYSLEDFEPVPHLVVTIGTFDGVHQGHASLIRRVKEVASELGGETLILTFFPHPRMVLYPEEHGVELLSTSNEKIQLLEEAGVDHLVIHPFDKEFSEYSADDFVRKILVKKLKVHKLVIGYDHRFGRDREGNFNDLLKLSAKYGFIVEKIPEKDVNEIAVSSSRVRNALKEGDVATARAFLGRPYSFTGTVIKGNKIGRTIGFPTANIQIPESYKLIPADGVYVVEVDLNNERFRGMLNIGKRPTIEMNGERSIEVYLIDFDREIYGSELRVHLLERIRADKKFADLDALRKQIHSDLVFTLNHFNEKN
jgi:riboflavin kinase / FMN adenylyltransferase